MQYQAIAKNAVKWKKSIILDYPVQFVINLPKQTLNLTLKKIEDGEERQATATITTSDGEIIEVSEDTIIGSVGLTGQVITKTTGLVTVNLDKEPGLLTRFFKWIKKVSVTGKVVGGEIEGLVKIEVKDNATQYEVEYYTEAPELSEQNISEDTKQVVVSADDELEYTNITADTILPRNVSFSDVSNIKLYHLVNGEKVELGFKVFDNNNDSIVDYITWTVSHLSNQTYEVVIESPSASSGGSGGGGGGGGGGGSGRSSVGVVGVWGLV